MAEVEKQLHPLFDADTVESTDRANATDRAYAAFIQRACNAHEKLLNACHAALSQLTEDREEYLEADIRQLREAIAQAEA